MTDPLIPEEMREAHALAHFQKLGNTELVWSKLPSNMKAMWLEATDAALATAIEPALAELVGALDALLHDSHGASQQARAVLSKYRRTT